jgi:ABC-2 type transport system ATP-binding protein
MLDAVRILDGAHLDPAAMVLREPTLDDVFLELTGHATSDGDETDQGGHE